MSTEFILLIAETLGLCCTRRSATYSKPGVCSTDYRAQQAWPQCGWGLGRDIPPPTTGEMESGEVALSIL